MKFFGWGKSKDPQPQTVLHHQVNKLPDARSGSHDRCKSGMGSVMPGKGKIRKQQGLFGVDEEGYVQRSATEEKLQDTIRFVFSHEREGLLAIGTFALDQLQSIRNTIDGHPKDHGLDSSALEQSSDDEDQLQRKWLAARQTCDLPVFGDSSGGESEPERDDSKALTLCRPDRKLNAGNNVKPVFLVVPPEIRRALDPASVLLKSPAPFVDEDYYSSRLCGLLRRKKSVTSKRGEIDGEENLKRVIPIEVAAQETKKSLMMGVGKLAKLWRASCAQSAARIAPARKPNPGKDLPAKDQSCVASGEVFTSPARQIMRRVGRLPADARSPKVAACRKRVQMHERMGNGPGELRDGFGSSRDDYGHWIKDDEDFVVLEIRNEPSQEEC